jgi:predicted nucleic acid-binding protein
MTAYLLDTNMISELRKPISRRTEQFNTWAETLNEQQTYLSVITVAEVERGLLLLERKDPAQAKTLRLWFEINILEGYAARTLPLTLAIARHVAALQVPNPRPFVDSLILATALEHRLTLVTRNVKDFQNAGVTIVNPWEATNK